MPKFNKNQITLKEAYAIYKKESENPVDYKTYKKVLDTWGDKVVEYLTQGKDVKLHHGLSMIGIRKKTKKFFVDRKASKEQGKRVVVPNLHSSFYGTYLYWRRHYTRFNSAGWSFKANRTLDRGVAKVMLQPMGHTTYVRNAYVTDNLKAAKSAYKRKVLGI